MCPKAFTCRFQRCNASYQRKEHLRRHEAQHSRRQLFPCSNCTREFGRNDTLRRHMQQVHGVMEPVPQTKHACTQCRHRKSRCQEGPPCSECLRRGIHCSLSQQAEGEQSGTQSKTEKERHFLGLYFKLFHPYWPFIHQGSFRESDETPLLVQAMTVIGLWVSNEHNAQSKAIDLHNVLSSAIHQQSEQWDASISSDACSSCSWPIATYQAILLHTIFAVLYKGSGRLGLDLKPCITPADAGLLNRLVASCKKLGMLYYPNMLARYCQEDLASYVWVSIEEVKRFNMALFKVCRAFRKQESSIGKLDILGLRARDLQFPLPRNTPLWNAVSKAEWESAAAEDVCRHSLDDTLEGEWISKSAEILELIEAD